jgi:hypothetical protein
VRHQHASEQKRHLERERKDDLKEREKEGGTCPVPDISPSSGVRQQRAPKTEKDDLETGRLKQDDLKDREKRRDGHIHNMARQKSFILCAAAVCT